MQKFSKILNFIILHRRPIGVLVGSILTIAGYPDLGDKFVKVNEVL